MGTHLEQHILKLEADMYEMSLLMQQADRHAVKARLSDFLVEMENKLARLRQDPAELDDDDRLSQCDGQLTQAFRMLADS